MLFFESVNETVTLLDHQLVPVWSECYDSSPEAVSAQFKPVQPCLAPVVETRLVPQIDSRLALLILHRGPSCAKVHLYDLDGDDAIWMFSGGDKKIF